MQMEGLEDNRNLHSEVEILNQASPDLKLTHAVMNSHFGSQVDDPRTISQWRSNRLLKNIYIVLIKAKINVLLPFGPLAVVLHYLTGKHVRLTDLSYCYPFALVRETSVKR